MIREQLRAVVEVVASLIDFADASDPPLNESLREAINQLLTLSPEVEIRLVRDHERQMDFWRSANDWRPSCLPRPELAQAYADWASGLAYVDRHGAYWLKRSKHNTRGRAPWSDLARRHHPHNKSFNTAALCWAEQSAEVAG
jgi:hypothetical protein